MKTVLLGKSPAANIVQGAALLLLVSCSSVPPHSTASRSAPASPFLGSGLVAKKIDQKVEQRMAATRPHSSTPAKRKRPNSQDQAKKALAKKSAPKLKLKYGKRYFKHWVDHFTQRNRPRFIRHLKRASKYRPTVRRVLRQHGLPEDLFFVALIESGFSTGARSHANAVGVWQFIKGTAKRYGLRVDRQVDERKNVHKATVAAANYFKDLYNIFGSWELALCAYNAGEYRIINAIRKGNTRNYLSLVRKGLIPRETTYYIPKVAAARHLAKRKSFARYLKHASTGEVQLYANAKSLSVRSPFSLSSLAQKTGVTYPQLKKLNPDIRRKIVRPGRRPFRLIVPQSGLRSVASVLKKKRPRMTQFQRRSHQKKKRRRSSLTYKVRRGDNLITIAARFGTSVASLKRWNKLRRNKIMAGQRLKVRRRMHTYVVKRGDSLFGIARRFGTSIAQIMRANLMQKKVIYPRQELLIPAKS